ncbi:hypothetical protein M431DRAFT_102340 [Trichoderma harzianum CBS 226.95]|uniref:Helicase ATP-binding domain-containing protein n=1 Tax=Trichoderma harzianum CBS 226.95 TaxID=983964 RepID=A0A2T3ZRF8_TRIHA|nr:hypothetical protein M431DRAFT_102340 [Trichoderma harzianum CBS 226.95]PTB47394.1 hypothetical protein M431DRAFT_102340 [Trichoderma harzianum CBS 226.95]
MPPSRRGGAKGRPKPKKDETDQTDTVEDTNDEIVVDFTPILRLEGINDWRVKPEANNFSVGDTAKYTKDEDTQQIRKIAKLWRDLGHCIGVQICHKWNTEPTLISLLARYNGMNVNSLANFADTVVCDIIQLGLFLLHHKFNIEIAQQLLAEHPVEEGAHPKFINDLLANSRTRINALVVKPTSLSLISPIELVKMYNENPVLKAFIEKIIKNLERPVFLPITRGVISRADLEDDALHAPATILAHAVQLLLFAPTNWRKEIEYTVRPDAYKHRYPTPPGHGGDCRTVAGMFSLEDLHRAVILVYLAIYRRINGTDKLKSTRQPQPRGDFKGYFDVERQIIEDTTGQEGPSQLAMARIMKNPLPTEREPPSQPPQSGCVRPSPLTTPSKPKPGAQGPVDLEQEFLTPTKPHGPKNRDLYMDIQTFFQYDWDDPDKVFAKVSEQITCFKSLIDEQKLIDFTESGSASTAVQEFLSQHPGDELGLINALQRQYALETTFNGHPPPEDTDLNAVCSRFGIAPYPSLELYPGQGFQPLKPHQVAGCIFEKLDTLGHVLFSNEMGLGKTKVFLAMIECKARDLEAKLTTLSDDDDHEIFFPSLIVNPPGTIHQTNAELKANFPGLKVLLYYGAKGQSRKFDSSKIVDKAEFLKVLRKLSPTDPQTARTVVMTTYNTFHCREVIRNEKRFIFLGRKEKGPPKKRAKTAPPPKNHLITDEAIRKGVRFTQDTDPDRESEDDGDDDYTPEEMLAFQAKRTQNSTKIRKYYKGDWEVESKRIHFLKDDEQGIPDGNLVEYHLAREALGDIKWSFLIVDEAHNARRVNGVTGTPLMGSLQDIISPLTLISPKLRIQPPPVGDMAIGYIQGLWHEDYKPDGKATHWKDGDETAAIFSEKFTTRYPSEGWAQMEEFWKRTGVKIWQLNPALVSQAGRHAEWSSVFGQNVISVVLQTLSLHRTLNSRLILPDGQVSFPGTELLPMTIITEELNFDRSIRFRVQEHGRNCASKTFIAGPSNTLDNFSPSQGGLSSHNSQEGSLNFSAYREGILVAYDWRNTEILYSNVEKFFGKDPDGILKTLRKLRDGDAMTNSQKQRLQRRAAKDAMPTVGVEHVQKLLSHDNNQGLDYFFTRTCPDPYVLPLTDRAAWVHWLAGTNPMLARTLELCYRYVHEKKERVLVYIDTPWVQQMMYAALLMAGYKTLTVRSADKPAAKVEAVEKFSDPRSDAQVFVANINIMSTGVNLHHACCYGILATFHFNAKTIQQVHGRLNRLGQKKAVIWHNLKVKDSFHDHQERMLLTKWSRQLSAESNLPQWMNGALREVMLFELMRAHWNQPFNRYSWVIIAERDGKSMDYYSEEAIKLGYCCSLLAKLVLFDKKEDYWNENDDFIAIALLELAGSQELEQLEQWLKLDDQGLRVTLELRLTKLIHVAKTNETNKEQIERFRDGVKQRQAREPIQIIDEDGSDSEDPVEDEDAELDNEKEPETATDEEPIGPAGKDLEDGATELGNQQGNMDIDAPPSNQEVAE